jgi:uncharacterized protein YceK
MKYLLIALMIFMAGCTTMNGTLDPTETATIRVAVGLAMTAEPKTVIPAYAVSTALLAILDGSEITTLDVLDSAVDEEINKLDLTAVERASFLELVALVKARIIQQLNLPDIDIAQRIVIVKNIIQIVRDASIARI